MPTEEYERWRGAVDQKLLDIDRNQSKQWGAIHALSETQNQCRETLLAAINSRAERTDSRIDRVTLAIERERGVRAGRKGLWASIAVAAGLVATFASGLAGNLFDWLRGKHP